MSYSITTESGSRYTVNDGLLWREGVLVGTLYEAFFFDAQDVEPLKAQGPFTVQYLLDNVPRSEGPAVGQYAYFSCALNWYWTTKIVDVVNTKEEPHGISQR